ncbi:hypothetical protein [Sedimentitalea todarodis]|uniref:4Fe-4S ferredoxin-type domain-containing protein n=1 Tax=Sedimentitalea todarodis TaxID=1631240 RepID=A0ABU3VIU9_9RHOB|nr:hypothetical protein [Sedimentitalea todarodis]MDU9006106.1 hypothetical protein [Sedimentitalea todarodis]
MFISRHIAEAPRTTALTTEIAKLNGPCIGCSECDGLCKELIEALVVPDVILSRSLKAQ